MAVGVVQHRIFHDQLRKSCERIVRRRRRRWYWIRNNGELFSWVRGGIRRSNKIWAFRCGSSGTTRNCFCTSASTTTGCFALRSHDCRVVGELASDASGRTLLARVLQAAFHFGFCTCLAGFATGSSVVDVSLHAVLLVSRAHLSPQVFLCRVRRSLLVNWNSQVWWNKSMRQIKRCPRRAKMPTSHWWVLSFMSTCCQYDYD